MPARTAFPLGRSLVVPSRAESMPYIVLEAAAAGMPLIATNVGGIPEIVNGTDTPLMPPGDVEVLERAMQGFLADPQRRQSARRTPQSGGSCPFHGRPRGRRGARVL